MSSPQRHLLLASLTATIALVLVAQEAAPTDDPRYALHDKAVAAQERGDLAAAKEAYEALLKINERDIGAREALATIEAELAAANTKPAPGPATPGETPVPADETPAVDPNTPLLEQVSRERAALYAEVAAAVAEARSLADAGRHDQALRLLADAERALPQSAGAKAQRDNVFLARQDVLSSREAGGSDAGRMVNQRMREVARRNQARVDETKDHISTARSLIRSGDLDGAKDQLDLAEKKLPGNVATQPIRREIRGLYAALLAERVNRAMDARDLARAQVHLKEYEALVTNKDNELDELPYRRLAALYAARKDDPAYRSIDEISPGLLAKDAKVEELLVKGRARYLYGDYQGALDTYREVLQYQPLNAEAKAYQVRIRRMLSENSGQWNRGVTKGKLLELLDESWKLPEVYNRETTGPEKLTIDPVLQKLKEITVPEINIKDLPLNRALDQLVIVSQAYDKESKGVNIVPIDPEKRNPSVNITLRNVSLDRALEFVVKQVNFTYTVNDGIIEVRPDSGSSDLETDFFPLPDAAVTKMTGISSTSSSSQSSGGSPFSPGLSAGPGDIGGASPREVAIRNFFTRSGVSFEVQGSTLAWDGAMLTATQTRRNLDRIRNILRRYSDTKQVHIEAKFIEVNESTLNELSANWQLSQTIGGQEVIRARTGLRGVNEAFGSSSVSNPGQILRTSATVDPVTGVISTLSEPTLNIPNAPPNIPRGNFGSRDFTFGGAGAAGLIGTIGSYDLNLFLRAVEQNNGSDLMSAPSLTVVDNKTATIRIVQQLRYPDSYGDVQSNVGQAGGQNGGGAAGVTITAGTPQDFKEQDVGVILEVTPTVQQDDSIALNLKPQVIEFEGFVEYGGTSVAIQGNTTVTIPSGFFQPIFSFREVTTDVTIFDGATVVIGGLTREEVKTVNDKVPVLGDIPLIGAAFRSTGKTTSKRNLMVFVTANLISPGGSTLRSKLPGVNNGATFSNPVVVTPGGAVYREVNEATAPAAPAPAAK
jgi:general secretion pathway protein D